MNQCRMFLLGCPNFYVAIDHLPLIPILGDKALDQIQNPRLRALKEKTLRFNFRAIPVPGKRHMAEGDQTSQDLIQVIRHGFPEQKNMLDDSLRRFYHMREDLYEVEGVPFLHGRMFVPVGLRTEVLALLHQAHQGVVGMKARARQSFGSMDWMLILSRNGLSVDSVT